MKDLKNDLGLVSAVAAALALSGCEQQARVDATRVCVDAAGQRVGDAYCGRSSGVGAGGYGWYYYGRGYAGYIAGVGERAHSGSTTPEPGVRYGSAIARGGFGSMATAYGAGS